MPAREPWSTGFLIRMPTTYFFINDDEAKTVYLNTKRNVYRRVSDPVSGESLPLGGGILLEAHSGRLEAYSGRWLRMEK